MHNSFSLFDITFVNGDYNYIISRLYKGCLMISPSGPGLATIDKDLRYKEAVQYADFAIPDSGYMILLLRIFKGIKIKKYSGYKFLKQFLNDESFFKKDLFLINPSEKEMRLNYNYLTNLGIPIDPSYQYIAPIYNDGDIEDSYLLEKLNNLSQKPKYIIINLGSNTQEPLGYYLIKNLNFKPGIICTGAVISFLTGTQANIKPIIDKLHLGWLWRCIKNPKVFIPRYFKAFRLFFLILKSEVVITR